MEWEMFDEKKYVYAIYPYDEHGEITGAYVGITKNIKERMKQHTIDKYAVGGQVPLHKLMKENGFCFQVLEECDCHSTYKEYDWIAFFKQSGVNLFNVREGIRSDHTRCAKPYGIPVWTGGGVAWQSDMF